MSDIKDDNSVDPQHSRDAGTGHVNYYALKTAPEKRRCWWICWTPTAMIPLSMYLSHNRVKVELGLCVGKKLHDKRQSMAERDVKRAMDRAIRQYK